MGMTDEYTCCGITFFTRAALGGHRGSHSATSRGDRPPCFTDDVEWASSIARLRCEYPQMSRISRNFALGEACAVCPLEFMQEMESKGRCHPPRGAVPQRDLGGEDE